LRAFNILIGTRDTANDFDTLSLSCPGRAGISSTVRPQFTSLFATLSNPAHTIATRNLPRTA
jgi:hypothetical protein